ncbi:GIY-YIG catalytic domain-containing endonuclease [Paramecium bursaria Chlorella virus OR0704.2.2]|nr:GIY-YIG catalytic domain-containing endonuclease [Paramecium bursaria Chlorella virus OR0704.2.2]
MITIGKNYFPKKSNVDKKIAKLVHKKNVIYSLYFPESDKMYIGQTEDFWHRMSGYRTSIKIGRLEKHQPKLYNAIHKYDYKFTITIMAIDVDTKDLDDTEVSYIEMFDTYKNGYNMTGGGKVLRGDAHPMFGKTHTEETKKQMRESHLGEPRPKSEEWCQEHSEKMKGENNPNFGGLSDEHRKKVQNTMLEISIQQYKSKGIDVSEENINRVLDENNGNMRQTAFQIGCTPSMIRRHCVRNGLIQNSK